MIPSAAPSTSNYARDTIWSHTITFSAILWQSHVRRIWGRG